MNKDQSRGLFLTTDHCSPEGTPTPSPLIPPRGIIIFPITVQIISLAWQTETSYLIKYKRVDYINQQGLLISLFHRHIVPSNHRCTIIPEKSFTSARHDRPLTTDN
jgi:hypothetical protein